jgi:hypothetical protein
MSSFIQKLSPAMFLRLGLGLMFLYSGVDIVRNPNAWSWAVRGLPNFIQSMIDTVGLETYLRLQGMSEILLAAALLAWFLPRKIGAIAGLIAGLEMLAITVLIGLDAVTFRDIGLVGAGFALFLLLWNDAPNTPSPRKQNPTTNPNDIIVETPDSIYARK